VTTIKGVVSRKAFEEHPKIKKRLWGGGGHLVSAVGEYGDEEVISNYVKSQGMEREYKQIQKKQLELF
jgi:hypothetical protein